MRSIHLAVKVFAVFNACSSWVGGLPWAKSIKSTTQIAASLLEGKIEADYSLGSQETMTTTDI